MRLAVSASSTFNRTFHSGGHGKHGLLGYFSGVVATHCWYAISTVRSAMSSSRHTGRHAALRSPDLTTAIDAAMCAVFSNSSRPFCSSVICSSVVVFYSAATRRACAAARRSARLTRPVLRALASVAAGRLSRSLNAFQNCRDAPVFCLSSACGPRCSTAPMARSRMPPNAGVRGSASTVSPIVLANRCRFGLC